ncbi:uncharacterized protein [Nicotiana sylvestris]|uniref:uncharacterized protein n=1 Tax=Nicotiana sylvestris TaxID=4096 RepID=UPI00388CB4DD
MGPTWFDVEFQVLDITISYNLLLGRPWIHTVGAVASTLHQAVKFEWNHQEVIIHGDGSNPIYTSQTIPVIGNRRRLGEETYHHIKHVNAIEKDKWWSNKIESILAWSGYEPDKGLRKNLQGITKPIQLKKEEYVRFLKEYEDIFAWSYDDVTGLSTSIVSHKLPTYPMCLPVKHKLRKFKPHMSLKIKEEVTKKIKAKVFRVVEYPTWLANIVPVLKKDGKVKVCVHYQDLNRASPQGDFPLSNIHILIDNCSKHELQFFVDCFAGYHQIWMDVEEAEKTTFITP